MANVAPLPCPGVDVREPSIFTLELPRVWIGITGRGDTTSSPPSAFLPVTLDRRPPARDDRTCFMCFADARKFSDDARTFFTDARTFRADARTGDAGGDLAAVSIMLSSRNGRQPSSLGDERRFSRRT